MNEKEIASSWIQLRVSPTRKSAYVKAARPQKLSKWAIATMDAAAGIEKPAAPIFTGAACHCRPGQHRDNCPDCEGTGRRMDFRAMRHRSRPDLFKP